MATRRDSGQVLRVSCQILVVSKSKSVARLNDSPRSAMLRSLLVGS